MSEVKQQEVILNYDCYSEDEFHYDDFVGNMEVELENIDKWDRWIIECHPVNWRGHGGICETQEFKKVIDALMFHDGQCNIYIHKSMSPNIIEGVSYHHDCPTGSHFTIKPLWVIKDFM